MKHFTFIRKIILLTLAAIMILGAFGCKGGNSSPKITSTPAKPTVPPQLTPQPVIEDDKTTGSFTVSRVFSSNMVLQRDRYISVWGWADAGSVIYGEFMGETRYGITDESGKWTVTFSPHGAVAENQTMRLYTKGGEETVFNKILVGDVWLVSGQSNAELSTAASLQYLDKQEVTSIQKEFNDASNVRMFLQTRAYAISDSAFYEEPQKDVINKSWKWGLAKTEYQSFSAIGSYFAIELTKLMPDVPIGMIEMAAGGAMLRELMAPESVEKLGFTTGAAVPSGGFYNSLIAPFVGLQFSGMLFYQGESESGGGLYESYASDLAVFVKDLRKAWDYEFPFYNVQLCSHGKTQISYWPELPRIRVAQYEALSKIAGSYLVCSMDCALTDQEDDWAHPRNKRPIGKRLAMLAASTYYDVLDYSTYGTPLPLSVKWNGSVAEITFMNTGTGLKLAEGDTLKGFQYLESGVYYTAEAKITGENTVEVECPQNAVSIGYGTTAQGTTKNANLQNSADIPVPAFGINNPNYKKDNKK